MQMKWKFCEYSRKLENNDMYDGLTQLPTVKRKLQNTGV